MSGRAFVLLCVITSSLRAQTPPTTSPPANPPAPTPVPTIVPATPVVAAPAQTAPTTIVVDSFDSVTQWTAVPAEGVEISVHPDSNGLHVGVGAPHGIKILRRLRRRILGLEVHRDADLSLFRGTGGAESLYRHSMRAHQVVRRDRRLEQVGVAWRQNSGEVATVGDHPRLVESRPHLHTIAQRIPHRRGVLAEPLGDVAIEPAATVVERLGQVPVVKRGVRLDVSLQQLVDEPRIEIDALLVDAAGALGEDASPGDAESVGVDAQLGHQRDVLFVAPVVIAGDIASLIEPGVAGSVRETVPDTATGAVGGGRAFDLVGRGGRAPQETVGKLVGLAHLAFDVLALFKLAIDGKPQTREEVLWRG